MTPHVLACEALEVADAVGEDLARLVATHEPFLRAIARRLCRDAPHVDDLVQDTFERAFRNLRSFQPGTNERAWLVTILRNLFVDRCREQHPTVPVDRVPLPAREPEPEPIWASITDDQIRTAMAGLSSEYRDVYQLHVEGRSYQEIAERLGIPKATVGTRLLRARRRLRELLSVSDEARGETA